MSRNFAKLESSKLSQMEGLSELLADMAIWTGFVYSMSLTRALTVLAILNRFEAFATVKIAQITSALSERR